MDQDSTWTKVGLSPGHIVLDGDPATAPTTQFSAHVCVAKGHGLIKMPFGTEAGLGPGDIASDGDPAPPEK